MITIVRGPASVDDDRRVLGLQDLREGRVAVAPPPAPVRAEHLYWEILEACGRTRGPDLLPGSFADRSWPIAALGGNGVRHVFVAHADSMPADAIRAVAAVIGDAGATAWLLADDPARLPFKPLQAARIGWEDFEARWLAPGVRPASAPAGRWQADAPDAPNAGSVTPSMLAGWAEVGAWAPTGDDREAAAAALCALLADRSDPACRAEMLKGAAGPLYNLGWQVRSGAGAEVLAAPASTAALRELLWYPEPLGAAAGYLLGRFPIGLEDALDLRMRDVAGDAAAVCIDGDWQPVEPAERVMLRGLLRLRERAAEGPADCYLDLPGFSRSIHNLRSKVRVAYRSVGLTLLEPTLSDRPGRHERRLARLDLGLRWVPRDEREPRGPTGFDVERIEAEMRAAAHWVGGLSCWCRCAVGHRAPILGELPPWPPCPNRPPTGVDHPFRRNAWRHRLPTDFDLGERRGDE